MFSFLWLEFHSVFLSPNHNITNQILPFSRSDAIYFNAAKIDPIQRWTHRYNFRSSDHTPHRQIHALHAHRIMLPAMSALSYLWPAIRPTVCLTQFATWYLFFFSKLKKKLVTTSEKEKKSHFILCFACIFFLFIFVCNIQKKKKARKKKNWHWPIKKEKKNSNFKFQNSRKKKRKEKGEPFVGYIFW